jgi:hypothetical protein
MLLPQSRSKMHQDVQFEFDNLPSEDDETVLSADSDDEDDE